MTRDDAALRRFLHGLPGVDQVGAEGRAAALATRSIKTTAKAWAIDTAIWMVDLTTLEGADTPGKVRSLCAKAARPDPSDPAPPSAAAVCVYPDLVATAVEARCAAASVRRRLGGHRVPVRAAPRWRPSCTTSATPSPPAPPRSTWSSTAARSCPGATCRCSTRSWRRRPSAATAHLKVILETGELATLDNVRRASWLALLAGGDFIKTSTGKVSPAATPPVALVMLEAVRDFRDRTGDLRGVKLAGGIRTSKEAVRYLVMVNEVAGAGLARPARCSASARPACSTTCCSSGTR